MNKTNMTITYGNQKLKDLFIEIKNGVLTVPSFQRGFAWSARDIARIYNSIIHKKEPFGSIVIWNDTANSKVIPNESKIFKQLDIKPSSSQKTYLIDGQQRVTSFLMSYIWHLKNKANHIGKIKKIKYDLNNKEFIIRDNEDNSRIPIHFFNLESNEDLLIKINEYLKTYSDELSREQERNLLDTYRSFQNIELGTVKIASDDLNEVIDVFTLINTKGKKLSPFNIVHAQYISKGNGYNLTAAYNKILKNKKNENSKWKLPYSTFLLLHYTVLHNTISNKDILDKSAEDVKKDIEFIDNDLERVYELTIDELEYMGYISLDYLPSDKFMYIIAKRVYDQGIKALSNSDIKIINKWFKDAAVNERYNSGAEGAKVNGFKEDWTSIKNLLDKEKYETPKWSKGMILTKEDIIEMSYGSTSLIYKYVLTRMIKNIPSIYSGKILGKNDINSDMKKLNMHHIFPAGHPDFRDEEWVNSIANLTPLERNENIDIGNESPSKYIKKYIKNDPYIKYLIVEKSFDNLKNFVESRAEIISKKINEEWN